MPIGQEIHPQLPYLPPGNLLIPARDAIFDWVAGLFALPSPQPLPNVTFPLAMLLTCANNSYRWTQNLKHFLAMMTSSHLGEDPIRDNGPRS